MFYYWFCAKGALCLGLKRNHRKNYGFIYKKVDESFDGSSR